MIQCNCSVYWFPLSLWVCRKFVGWKAPRGHTPSPLQLFRCLDTSRNFGAMDTGPIWRTVCLFTSRLLLVSVAHFVGGRRSAAGELKVTGQRLLSRHAYRYTSALCRHTHTFVWLQTDHWSWWGPQLVVASRPPTTHDNKFRASAVCIWHRSIFYTTWWLMHMILSSFKSNHSSFSFGGQGRT